MNKKILTIVLSMFLMLSAIPIAQVSGQVPRADEIAIGTIGEPETVDPGWLYDTASAEIVMNVYDTLIAFYVNRSEPSRTDWGRTDQFEASLATEWWLDETGPKPVYYFKIREECTPFQCYITVTGVTDPSAPVSSQVTMTAVTPGADPGAREFHIDEWEDVDVDGVLSADDLIQMTRKDTPPSEYPDAWTRDYIVESFDGVDLVVKPCLTCWDIEYSFERWFVLDHGGGPQWMIYEPLTYPDYEWNFTDPNFADRVDAAIETNCTHVWFTFAGEYPTMIFLQVIAQSWASILYMDWAMDQGCWDGDWATVATYHDPLVSPLMDPEPVMCGTGPYYFVEWITGRHWVIERFDEHWQQWPAPGCDGYVDIVRVEFIPEWPTRKLMFLAGDLDFCYVPRMYMADVDGKPGVRCDFPLPSLVTGGNFFNFDIATTSRYLAEPFTETLAVDQIKESGIPPNFFTDKNLRKAFCYSVNYTEFLDLAYLGEAKYPATPAIYGLPYRRSESWYEANQYNLDLDMAEYYFKMAWGGSDPDGIPNSGDEIPGEVWTKGFTLPLCYNTGNIPRRAMAEDEIETNVEMINTNFHIDVYSVEWGTVYIPELFHGELTMFIIGWLADYPDPHNFFFPFMHTYGAFSDWQSYSDPYVDALIEEGGTSSNETRRKEIYYELQEIYIEDAPSVCTYQATGRHWERDWVQGWYYNPIYPGGYFKHYWKAPPTGVTMEPVDVSALGSMTDLTGVTITVTPCFSLMTPAPIAIEVTVHRLDTNPDVAVVTVIIGVQRTDTATGYSLVIEGCTEMAVLTVGESYTAVFEWNETELPGPAGYEMSGLVGVVSNFAYDEDATNNIVTDGTITVKVMISDINCDGVVDIKDIATAAKAFGSYPGHDRWNSVADIDGNKKIDIRDIATIAKDFGKTLETYDP